MVILVVWCGLLGLAIGSFLTVVAYRVPRHMSIVRPGSRCPACASPVRAYDNVPVVSWLVLRGRCRDCGVAISPRYPIVELATGGLFGVLAAWVGAKPVLPVLLVAASVLVAGAAVVVGRRSD